jgi:hypothetical protein
MDCEEKFEILAYLFNNHQWNANEFSDLLFGSEKKTLRYLAANRNKSAEDLERERQFQFEERDRERQFEERERERGNLNWNSQDSNWQASKKVKMLVKLHNHIIVVMYMLFVDTLRCTVTNWTRSSKSAEFEYVDGKTTFPIFKSWVKGNLMNPDEYDFNIYFLADPTASGLRKKIIDLDGLHHPRIHRMMTLFHLPLHGVLI